MAQRKHFTKQTKEKAYLKLDGWLTMLEMRAFGWTYKGIDSEQIGWDAYTTHSSDYSSSSTSIRPSYYTYQTFRRIKPYTYNIFFIILELLMSIISCIRRKFVYVWWTVGALFLGIGLVGYYYNEPGMFGACVSIGIGIFIGMYVPTFALCIVGFLFRKIFGIDRKLKKSLVKNGYKANQRL